MSLSIGSGSLNRSREYEAESFSDIENSFVEIREEKPQQPENIGAYEMNKARLSRAMKFLEEKNEQVLRIREQVKKCETQIAQINTRKEGLAQSLINELQKSSASIQEKKGQLCESDLLPAASSLKNNHILLSDCDKELKNCSQRILLLNSHIQEVEESYQQAKESVEREIDIQMELSKMISKDIEMARELLIMISKKV